MCTFRAVFFLKMKHLKIVLILLMTTSCQYFETDKISKETFYKQELETIDWKDVDQYPTFPLCENDTEKTDQQRCFENALSSHLKKAFTNNNATAVGDLNDTITIQFSISNIGKLSTKEIQITGRIQAEFPRLQEWLEESIDTLPLLAPAYKRGIPVTTQFVLPITVTTSSL
jgi:hypothetical protein